MNTTYRTSAVKILIGWLTVLVVRLIPWRMPNIEPVLATLMPFSGRYGAVVGFGFGFLSMIIFDLVTGNLGSWTVITGIAYGLLGLAGGWYFRSRSGVGHYVGFSVVGTLLYDAVTGLSIGPLFFGQPFMEALVGQVPFTAYHVAGNIVFAALLSPMIHRFVVENEALETDVLLKRLVRA